MRYFLVFLISIVSTLASASPKCEFYSDRIGRALPADQCCPLEMGETRKTACKKETEKLNSVLQNLAPAIRFIYSDGNTTRGPILFSSKESGQISRTLFNDYFKKDSVSALVDHYFVQTENGKYVVYRDRKFDGKVEVDAHFPGDAGDDGDGIEVYFDPVTELPSWTASFPRAKSDPLEFEYLNLTHNFDKATFTKLNGTVFLEYDYIGAYVY